MKRILNLLMLVIAIAVSASAADNVAVFTVNPGMSCQNCELKIKNNLRHEAGVKKITTSLQNQTVTVVYDAARTSQEALVKAFKKIGYAAAPATEKTAAKAGQSQLCGNQCQKMQSANCRAAQKINATAVKANTQCCTTDSVCVTRQVAPAKAARKAKSSK